MGPAVRGDDQLDVDATESDVGGADESVASGCEQRSPCGVEELHKRSTGIRRLSLGPVRMEQARCPKRAEVFQSGDRTRSAIRGGLCRTLEYVWRDGRLRDNPGGRGLSEGPRQCQ